MKGNIRMSKHKHQYILYLAINPQLSWGRYSFSIPICAGRVHRSEMHQTTSINQYVPKERVNIFPIYYISCIWQSRHTHSHALKIKMNAVHDNTIYTFNDYTATERNTVDMGLLYNQQHVESYEQNWSKIEKHPKSKSPHEWTQIIDHSYFILLCLYW